MSFLNDLVNMLHGQQNPAQQMVDHPQQGVVVNTGQNQLRQPLQLGQVQGVEGYAPQPYGQGFENMVQQGGYNPQTSAHAFFAPGQGQYGGMPVQNPNMFMPGGGVGGDPFGWMQNNNGRIKF